MGVVRELYLSCLECSGSCARGLLDRGKNFSVVLTPAIAHNREQEMV